jgi:hypothetical protein
VGATLPVVVISPEIFTRAEPLVMHAGGLAASTAAVTVSVGAPVTGPVVDGPPPLPMALAPLPAPSSPRHPVNAAQSANMPPDTHRFMDVTLPG